MDVTDVKNSLFEMEVNLLDMQIIAKTKMLLFMVQFENMDNCEGQNMGTVKKDIAILKKKRARLFKEKMAEMDYLDNK